MATSKPIDPIVERFCQEFNAAQKLYASDELAECMTACQALLDEPAIPRYYRIRTLVLLGGIVPEWYEAAELQREAELQWYIVRRWHVKGENLEIDGSIGSLWTGIMQLKTAVQSERELEEKEREERRERGEYSEEVEDDEDDTDEEDDENEDEEKVVGQRSLLADRDADFEEHGEDPRAVEEADNPFLEPL